MNESRADLMKVANNGECMQVFLLLDQFQLPSIEITDVPRLRSRFKSVFRKNTDDLKNHTKTAHYPSWNNRKETRYEGGACLASLLRNPTEKVYLIRSTCPTGHLESRNNGITSSWKGSAPEKPPLLFRGLNRLSTEACQRNLIWEISGAPGRKFNAERKCK
ncbi:hypothetical protein TNCV_5062871 [Trichonephila clavipes]|nr:hypothetical protein TNCV_5062871 [Trichonephila clavipes]